VKNRTITAILLSGVLMAAVTTVRAQVNEKLEDESDQSAKAAKVFKEIMSAPDRAIPKTFLIVRSASRVFPNVIKAGFIVGDEVAEVWRAAELQAGGALPRTSISEAVA
jgi:lipid-binding SYLF domain-containing protein